MQMDCKWSQMDGDFSKPKRMKSKFHALKYRKFAVFMWLNVTFPSFSALAGFSRGVKKNSTIFR